MCVRRGEGESGFPSHPTHDNKDSAPPLELYTLHARCRNLVWKGGNERTAEHKAAPLHRPGNSRARGAFAAGRSRDRGSSIVGAGSSGVVGDNRQSDEKKDSSAGSSARFLMRGADLVQTRSVVSKGGARYRNQQRRRASGLQGGCRGLSMRIARCRWRRNRRVRPI